MSVVGATSSSYALPGASEERVKVFNDAIHGHMELSSVCVCVCDTPEFQRLRDLRQLGAVYEVFPAASHNRFEHSLGVAHLARYFVRMLAARQPELCVSRPEMLCVEIAGLCHDLGHGVHSHAFDHSLVQALSPPGSPGRAWQHEHGSVAMFEHLVKRNGLMPVFEREGLTPAHVHFIQELILGDASEAPPGWEWRGWDPKKRFLFEIVANKVSGIDADKLDYFSRDCRQLNIAIPFDASRLLKFARVITVDDPVHGPCSTIAYASKEAWNIYSLFSSRYSLHKRAYQHKVARCIELMYTEALVAAEPYVRIPGTGGVPRRLIETVFDMEAYTKVSDYLLRQIAWSEGPELKPARDILHRIFKRQLYTFIGETIYGAAAHAPHYHLRALAGNGPAISLSAVDGAHDSARRGDDGLDTPSAKPLAAHGRTGSVSARVEGYSTEQLVAPRKEPRAARTLESSRIRHEIFECALALLQSKELPAPSTPATLARTARIATFSSLSAPTALDAFAAEHLAFTGTPAAAPGTPPRATTAASMLVEDDLIVEIINISWGMGNKNPVDRVWFYHFDKETQTYVIKPISRTQVSSLVPDTFQETYVRVYCRRAEFAGQARKAFSRWCQLNDSEPPIAAPSPTEVPAAGTKRPLSQVSGDA